MSLDLPAIKGEVHTDRARLERYSTDMGGYRVRPLAVIVPEGEDDLRVLVDHAEKTGIPITARGSGSNLCGSAVGEGLVLLFSKMSRLLWMEGDRVRLQPGVKYDGLNAAARSRGRTLRYDVSSGGFSTVGGNLATKAGGLRSVKYGTVDDALLNVRFVSPAHGVVDTAGGLPPPLEKALLDLRGRLLGDEEALRTLERKRGVKSSSGYNVRAFIDRTDPASMAAHLMAGSAGTLGVFSEIEMTLVSVPPARALCILFFTDFLSAVRAASQIAPAERQGGGRGHREAALSAAPNPSACEALDATCTALLGEVEPVPRGAEAALLVEFDENPERGMAALGKSLEGEALDFRLIDDEGRMDRVWEFRKSLLTKIKRLHEDGDHRYISFVDDMAVPARHLPDFVEAAARIFASEGMKTVMYGHACEGNLHIRPLVAREDWKERARRAAERCFDVLLAFGGTLTAEHGAGRNRAAYLRREWGERMYGYFREVKNLFDPRDVLNPGVMFSERDFTSGYIF